MAEPRDDLSGDLDDEGVPQFSLPPIGEPDPEPEPQDTGPTLEERLAALEAERTAERERYEATMARQQQTIDRLLQGIPAQAAPAPAPEATLDLPDPVEKPEEFRRAVIEQITRTTAQERQRQQAETRASVSMAEVRQKFWDRNSDLTEYPEFVESAYNKEATRLRSMGLDPQVALLRDPEGISERVAEIARARIAALGIVPKGEAAPRRQGRTAGVSSASSPAAAKPNGRPPVSNSDFLDELKRQQVESGFY